MTPATIEKAMSLITTNWPNITAEQRRSAAMVLGVCMRDGGWNVMSWARTALVVEHMAVEGDDLSMARTVVNATFPMYPGAECPGEFNEEFNLPEELES